MNKQFEKNKDGYNEMTQYFIRNFGDILKYKIKNKKSISCIFLAGAPGAGKTEFLETIFYDLKSSFIVIDIDKYRKLFQGYNGDNSNEYQNSSLKVAEKILSFCFKNNLNFIFDGTFRNFNKIKENFGQCKKYNRKSLITLIFQEPRISFYYTFLRKIKKQRNVPIDVFVDGFYSSIKNVFKATKNFENIDLMIASKKYTFLYKDNGYFNIDYNTDNIFDFCSKYRIDYRKGEFKNKKNLILDIKKYNNILIKENLGKGSLYLKAKLWTIKKFLNNF